MNEARAIEIAKSNASCGHNMRNDPTYCGDECDMFWEYDEKTTDTINEETHSSTPKRLLRNWEDAAWKAYKAEWNKCALRTNLRAGIHVADYWQQF